MMVGKSSFGGKVGVPLLPMSKLRDTNKGTAWADQELLAAC